MLYRILKVGYFWMSVWLEKDFGLRRNAAELRFEKII